MFSAALLLAIGFAELTSAWFMCIDRCQNVEKSGQLLTAQVRTAQVLSLRTSLVKTSGAGQVRSWQNTMLHLRSPSATATSYDLPTSYFPLEEKKGRPGGAADCQL